MACVATAFLHHGASLNGIDPALARALGWPKPKFAWVERERRWLCREVPPDLVTRSERLRDLYVTETRLRLWGALPMDRTAPMLMPTLNQHPSCR